MTDLPGIELEEEKRLEILKTIDAVVGRIYQYQPGDISADDIMKRCNVARWTALKIMRKTVASNPNLEMVLVTLPFTRNSRTGYVIRMKESQLPSETTPELSAPSSIEPAKS